MLDLKKSERANNILDFEINSDFQISQKDEEPNLPENSDLAQYVHSQYMPKNTFFDCY